MYVPLPQFFILLFKNCYMDLLHRFEFWGDRHHPKWMDIVRIALGIFLCIKGIQFPQNMSALLSKMPNDLSGNSFLIVLLSHYVLFGHLMGGILMILGVFTRFACLIQIPILLGAIIFVHSFHDLWKPYSEFYLSLLVLALLLYFLIAGNGSLSVARFLTEEKKK
jgi:putative oxidoreductase